MRTLGPLVALYFVGLVIGFWIGQSNPKKDCTVDGTCVGDQVRFKSDAEYAKEYNSCRKMTVIGLQAVSRYNVAWILLEDCTAFNFEPPIFTDIVSQSVLEKEKK